MITLFSDNLVHQGTMTATTENASFPLSNIKDPRRTKVFRSTANTVDIIFDFIENSGIDSILLCDNYKNGFGFTSASYVFAMSSSFSTPLASGTIDFDANSGVTYKDLGSVVNARFMKLTLTSTLPYCELSKIFVGKKITLNGGNSTAQNRSINFGWTYKNKDLSLIKDNRYGQRFGDKIARQRQFNTSFANLTKDHVAQLASISDVKGIVEPFWVHIGSPDMTATLNRYTGMVFLADIPQESNGNFNKFNMPFNLEEAM